MFILSVVLVAHPPTQALRVLRGCALLHHPLANPAHRAGPTHTIGAGRARNSDVGSVLTRRAICIHIVHRNKVSN